MTLATVSRRTTLQAGLTLASVPLLTAPAVAAAPTNRGSANLTLTTRWDKTFPQSSRVAHRKVTFDNRFGITIAADLYQPKNGGASKLPALVLSGPFGAVKEQVAGLYAQTLAERGFVTLAFDPSFTGESGGAVRNEASAEFFT
jgi:fermentation-respiration switch protein FrsA (DUF1100 family)